MDKHKKDTLISGAPRSSPGSSGLWIMIAACVLLFLVMHAWNLNGRFIEFKWDGAALGNYSHQLWSISHSTTSGPSSSPWYLIPAILYVLAPIYQLFPSLLFLPIVQTIALAIAAVAVFFTGNIFLSKARALILALLFCFYPPIYAICTASFSPAVLALPFLMLSIYFLLKERRGLAMLFAAMILLCDLRAGLSAVPLCLWASRRFADTRWYAVTVLTAAAGIWGWIYLPAEDGMGPLMIFGALSAPYVIYGLCLLERWVDRVLSRRSIFLALLSPVFFAGVVCASAVITPAMMDSHPGISRLPVRQSAMMTLLKNIPENAEVLTTPVFLPRFSNRPGIGLLGEKILSSDPSRTRYALADLGGAGTNLDQAEEAGAALRELMTQGWGPIQEVGGIVLFSDHPGAALQNLYTPNVDVSKDRPYLVLRAGIRDAIELVGFTMNPDAENPDLIRFSFYWRKLGASAVAYAPQLSVVGSDGRRAYSVQRLMCYGLYPFEEWKIGEIVKDDFLFVVPDDLQGSAYELRLGLLERPRNRPAAMSSPVEGALDPEGRVRLIALDAI